MTTKLKIEPKPEWVLSLRDLSQETAPGCYRVTPGEGEAFEIIISKRKRQVVDTMIKKDLFCASTVRIGDIVFRLKEDNNLHTKTKTLSNGRKYYSLEGSVEFLGPVSSRSKVRAA